MTTSFTVTCIKEIPIFTFSIEIPEQFSSLTIDSNSFAKFVFTHLNVRKELGQIQFSNESYLLVNEKTIEERKIIDFNDILCNNADGSSPVIFIVK